MIRVAAEAGDRELEVSGRIFWVVDLLELGETTTAEAESLAVARMADELRQPYQQWRAAVQRAM